LSKIDHGVILCVFGQNKATKGGKYLWIVMGHLIQLGREKKTSIYFESSLICFESIMDFTKKIQSSVSLIAFIVFSNSIGVENTFIGPVN